MKTNNKVNYEKIYKFLDGYKGKVITASMLARNVDMERIYGATMLKLVREGWLSPAPEKGFYYVNKNMK